MYPIEHEESAANRSAATGKRSRLCDKCENIDFESALRSAAQSRLKNEAVRILIANVGNRLRQSTIHNCDLCSRLAKNRIGDVCGDEDEIFGIDPHDLWEALGRKGGLSLINDPLYLFIKDVGEPKDVLIAANRGELGVKKELLLCTLEANKQLNASLPRVLPSRFDAGHVLPWLQDCFNNHGNVCAKKVRHVSGLQLIDCHSMNITDAPVGATYTALSYVWSSPNGSEAEVVKSEATCHRRLPSNLSQVVLDAISVTICLGLNWLWVDRYCIDQGDPTKKHEQIRQMDAVYEGAELTIIAASGGNERHGLPGIGSPRANSQFHATHNKVFFISQPHHPIFDINNSVWYTRGWTFQESCISRRRLCFTDQQVYFQCNCTAHQESQRVPEPRKLPLQLSLASWELPMLQLPSLPRECMDRYWKLVQYYTMRSLRYDSDVLNAFTGIIRKFEHGLIVIWGLPCQRATNPKERVRQFVRSLSWHHWHNIGYAIRRRHGFPSWSWAGWEGEISYYPELKRGFVNGVESVMLEYSLEGKGPRNPPHNDGLLDPHDKFEATMVATEADDTHDHGRILTIRTCRIPLGRFKHFRKREKPRRWYTCHIWNNKVDVRLSYDTTAEHSPFEELGGTHALDCAYLGQSGKYHLALLLEKTKNGTYERIGLIEIEDRQANKAIDSVSGHQSRLLAHLADGKNFDTFRIE